MAFKCTDFTADEKLLLGLLDKQLSIPGHNPTTLYLRRTQLEVFQRAARRAEHFEWGLPIKEDEYKGVKVQAARP